MLSIPNLSPKYPIFGTKSLPCRRFLQHYYRDTFIESHRKPIEVPQISYRGRLICKTLFLYQRYTKGIQRAGNSSTLVNYSYNHHKREAIDHHFPLVIYLSSYLVKPSTQPKCSKCAICCKNIWIHQIFSLPLQPKCRNLYMNMRQIQ